MHSKKCIVSSLLTTLCFIPGITFSMPLQIDAPGEKMVVVSPITHEWGAYTSDGKLVKSGLAAAGADWCPDMGQECHTSEGLHRVNSLGGPNCVSPSFPIPRGGAPMPYCMYFTKYQALHGSYELAHKNISHGCVRMRVSDAKWLRYHFVEKDTLVKIESY